MTKLLQQVLEKVAALPKERQDDAAHVLLAMLENDAHPYPMSAEDLHEIDLAIAEPDAGRFASDADVEAVLHRSWS